MGDIINSSLDLLHQVHRLKSKYDAVERATGERYNVFEVLGVSSLELRHSRMIAELLNPKGCHGQGEVYLSLFLETLSDHIATDGHTKFDKWPDNELIRDVSVQVEFGIGWVTGETGGRVDIMLSSGGEFLLIENKIHAALQKQQLQRYLNHEGGGPVLYLTLVPEDVQKTAIEGSVSSDVPNSSRLFHITYHTDILNWLEKCHRQSAALPKLRETIVQYCEIIKLLTYQNPNNKMTEEIAKIICSNRSQMEAFFVMSQCKSAVYGRVAMEMRSFFAKLVPEIGLELQDEPASSRQTDAVFSFTSDSLRKHHISLDIRFDKPADFQDLFSGLRFEHEMPNRDSIITATASCFEKISGLRNEGSPGWPVGQWFREPWLDWGPDQIADFIFNNQKREEFENIARSHLEWMKAAAEHACFQIETV